MLPESHMIDQRFSISLDNVKYRIQLQDLCQYPCKSQIAEIPHNRRYPHPYLKADVDDLAEIPEKHHYCAGKICYCKNQHKDAKAVINQLQRIKGWRISHAGVYHQNDQYKKAVYKACGDHLYYRKDPDVKYHLLYQIIILQQRAGSSYETILKKEPGYKSRHQPEYKRHSSVCAAPKSQAKNKPVDADCHHRLDKGPDSSKIGTCIFCFKIIFCQGEYQPSVSVQLPDQTCFFFQSFLLLFAEYS